MASLRNLRIRIQAALLSLFRKSFRTHASVRVSDQTSALAFYRRLGFRPVTSSRGAEVTLLRNHRGDELNIVTGSGPAQPSRSAVSFRVENLHRQLADLQTGFPGLETIEDAMTRRLQVADPDGNVIEFYQQIDRSALTDAHLYHIATRAELSAGLSEHYYLPPERENRFVRARARSAFIALACKRVAEEANGTPLIIEMDENGVSIEAQLLDDAEFDSSSPGQRSAYPRVNSPIPRQALTAVGVCGENNGDFSWPSRFAPVAPANQAGP